MNGVTVSEDVADTAYVAVAPDTDGAGSALDHPTPTLVDAPVELGTIIDPNAPDPVVDAETVVGDAAGRNRDPDRRSR